MMIKNIKNFIQSLSIQKKITFLVITITILSLILAGILQLINIVTYSKSNLLNTISTTAEVLGTQSTAAIEFMDENAANENLRSVRNIKSITTICMYNEDGEVFSHYMRDSDPNMHTDHDNCPTVQGNKHYFTFQTMEMFYDIHSDGESIGTLFIVSDLDYLYQFMIKQILYGCLLFVVALVAAYFLARRFQRIITDSILSLSATARGFAKNKDYTIRAEEIGDDELGDLAKAFNEMLDEIETRDTKLKKAVSESEEANRLKSEFLANMSHELRTPLNSLLVLSQELMENDDGNLTREQIEDADIIYTSGQDLLTLINEILDLSKVESGKMELDIGEVYIKDVVTNMNKKFLHVAEKNDLTFDINVDKSAPPFILSDKLRTEQILLNFLSNAFKFTHNGGIVLDIKRSGNDIVFSVTDTGIGIEEDKFHSIFEAFQQVDGSTSRKYGGTGLGLSISQELSILLGGTIEVTSEVDKGSTFTLCMPIFFAEQDNNNKDDENLLTKPNKSNKSITVSDDRGNIKSGDSIVMVIEDDPRFAKILRDRVRDQNSKSVICESGNRGISLAIRYKPNIIILDVQLPDISGLDVYDKIKKHPDVCNIPIYFMTIYDNIPSMIVDSAVGYLKKPVDIKMLDDAFVKIESIIKSSLQSLLLVEDDCTLRATISKLAIDRNIYVKAVATAEEALEILKEENMECMVLDITLPGMSGIELLEHISEHEHMSMPRAIVYSGADLSPEDQKKVDKYTHGFIKKNGKSLEQVLDQISDIANADSKVEKKKVKVKNIEKKNIEIQTKPTNDGRSTKKKYDFSGKKILIVDDDHRNIFSISRMISKTGAKIYTAENGQEAIDIIEQMQDFDVVLMDIMMPVMNGYEATEYLRKQSNFKSIPIIAVTAKAMKNDVNRCFEAGANAYVAKPIDKKELFSAIEKLI